jgi:4-oxalocrotonate tautomerase
MPHILVKLHSGRSDQQKALLAEEVTRAVMKALDGGH